MSRSTASPRLVVFAREQNIAFTVVGRKRRWPLAWWTLSAPPVRIFGPTQYAAQLESSKDFAKAFMQRHGIPTAGYQTFTDAAAARAYVDGKGRRCHQGRRPGRRQGRGGGDDAGRSARRHRRHAAGQQDGRRWRAW